MITRSCTTRSLLCINGDKGFGESPNQKRDINGKQGSKTKRTKTLKGKNAFRKSIQPSPSSQKAKTDFEFEKRLAAVKTAEKKKKEEEEAPVEESKESINQNLLISVSILLLVALIITSAL